MKHSLLVFSILYFVVCTSCSTVLFSGRKQDLSPLNFGLAKARNGVERYNVLYETHKAAIAAGVNVDYTGIKKISIEIPQSFTPIPLSQYNDFKGCTIEVLNKSKNAWLFTSSIKGKDIAVSKASIDNGDFSKIPALAKGKFILLIEDMNPWVIQRKNHDYGHQRQDLLLIENGKAVNSVVMPYNNKYSNPSCTYINASSQPLVIKNLNVVRDKRCSYVTYVFNVSGYDGVDVSNVVLKTPENNLNGDRAFRVFNSSNVSFVNVTIDGTYSQKDKSGYGISLRNIWNFKAKNLKGNGNWGIFGTNNVNTVTIENSHINRFDIHCYGKDISFYNVEFFDLYNQFASVYGTIRFEKCTFTNFVPVLNGGSYNAFVAHDVVFNDCVFNCNPSKNFFFKLSGMSEGLNTRNELKEKCLPNVTVSNSKLIMSGGVHTFLLFNCRATEKKLFNIGHLSKIDIEGLTIMADDKSSMNQFTLSNIELKTKKDVDCQISDVEVMQGGMTKSLPMQPTTIKIKANMPLKGGKVVLRKASSFKQ